MTFCVWSKANFNAAAPIHSENPQVKRGPDPDFLRFYRLCMTRLGDSFLLECDPLTVD